MIGEHILSILVYKIMALKGKQINLQKYSQQTQLLLTSGVILSIEILTIKWQRIIMCFHLVGLQ